MCSRMLYLEPAKLSPPSYAMGFPFSVDQQSPYMSRGWFTDLPNLHSAAPKTAPNQLLTHVETFF